MQGTVGGAVRVQLWALPWTAPLCRAMSACGLPSMYPVGSHVAVWPTLLPRPPCTPKLTVLSMQATERPAKRLATPRATLTSSLRMSSQRLLRNLNNLSVYVATPGEKRKGGWWMVAQCAGWSRDTCHRWFGPQVDRSSRQGECSPQQAGEALSVWGVLGCFRLREETGL